MPTNCTPTSNTQCVACSICNSTHQHVFAECTATADTSCDDNIPYYVTFVVHLKMDTAQFFAKPRTFLVSVGVSTIGRPAVDSKGNNLTTDDDWAALSIIQRIAAFGDQLGIGEANETGAGLIKGTIVQTAVRVLGPKTAEEVLATKVACPDCLESMQATFVAEGFTNSNGDVLLLNITDPLILRTLPYPVSSDAPPPRPRPAPAATAAAALLAAALYARTAGGAFSA
jgi:hypothetical protein